MRQSIVLITGISVLVGLGACQGGGGSAETAQKLERLEKNTLRLGKQLTETINKLEKQVEGLSARVAQMERGAAAGSARASVGVGGGVQRRVPMSPDLQHRLDKFVVDALEKLGKNKNARDAANAMFKMLSEAFKKEAKRVEKTP